MATGATAIPIAPGSRKVGAKVVGGAEASAQSSAVPKGGVVIRSSDGFLKWVGTGVVTRVFGFAVKSGQNLASDGAKKATVFRVEPSLQYKGVLAGTWAASLRQATAVLSVNSAGSVVLTTGTAVSASSASGVIIQDAAPGWAVGDVNAVVLFTVASSGIQD